MMRGFRRCILLSAAVVFIAGCQSAGRQNLAESAALLEEEPSPATASAAAEPATASMAAEPAVASVSAAAAGGGQCSGSQTVLAGGPPPVPSKVASFAGGVAENAGRNVARNTGTAAANQVVSRIPGIGGVIGVATTQVAAKEVVRTAEDVRGTWSVTDGSPDCGCELELSRPGMVVARNAVAAKGCASPLLNAATRWNVVDTGFAKQDLVLLAGDGKTEVARLDRKGIDYFQGVVGGTTYTVWR